MKIKIDPLDKLFSCFVRLRAEGHCEFCGKAIPFNRLQCSHFHGRRKRTTRYDPQNAACLCFSCHQYLGEHPNMHTEWFKRRIGDEEFEKLWIRSQRTSKEYPINVEELKAELKEKIRGLDGS